jgi:HAD superfamily hydrolase (TIGR01509 family)
MSASTPPPLRAIFFDAGNTLLRMNYAAIAERLEVLGRRVPADDLQRAEWRARVRLDDDVFARRTPGTSTETGSTHGRYMRYLLEEAGAGDDALVKAMTEWRLTYNAPAGLWNVVDPDADAALTLARDAGLRTAVFSNSNGTIRGILESLGLARHLDFVIDSREVGVEKPDPRIFGLALTRAGLAPAEAVYIGDIYSIDVVGARSAGMDAVLIDPGRCWGTRDCPAAVGPLDAVRTILDRRRGGSSTRSV